MRLVSQDGLNGVFDFPYEKCIVYIYNDMKTIKIQPVGEENSQFIVAKYSTEEKALKAMEMLREYKETKEIKSMLLTKSILESFTNTKIKNFEIHTDGMGDYFKVDIVKKVEYFKFPADEEVEV